MDNSLVLGVDIGGSHITAALVDLETSVIVKDSLVRREVDAQGTAEEIIQAWTDVMKESMEKSTNEITKVGMSVPGPFDYDQGISMIKDQAKYDALYMLNVKNLIADKLGLESKNIKMLNDAEGFLQGEVFSGTAQGFSKVVGLTLGTGLGTSRYNNGKAVDANLWCAPFKGSIAEDFLSTRWFVSRYQQLTGVKVKGVKELASLVEKDENAGAVFNEFGANLGKFLSEYVMGDKPDVVIFGGNIANSIALFLKATKQTLNGFGNDVLLVRANLGERAALIGAASCCNEKSKIAVGVA